MKATITINTDNPHRPTCQLVERPRYLDEHIVLPEGCGVTIPFSFLDCNPIIRSVEIPEGVVRIEGNAFRECANLQRVNIPSSVTSIEGGAFADCPNLEIEWHESFIRENGVVYNSDKTEIVAVVDPIDLIIPESITKIDKCQFARCPTLRSVVIPPSIKRLPRNSFMCCYSLRQVTLSEGLEEIDSFAFMRCRNLEQINIPDSVTELSEWAFRGSEKLQIEWSSRFIQENGVVYNAARTMIIWVDNPVDFVLPKGVIYFDFSGCATLRTIIIPKWVEVLECSHFMDCTALEEVSLPEGLKVIGHNMFKGCTKLRKVNIPQSVTKIYDTSFNDCPRELRHEIYDIIEEREIELVDWDYEQEVEYLKK